MTHINNKHINSNQMRSNENNNNTKEQSWLQQKHKNVKKMMKSTMTMITCINQDKTDKEAAEDMIFFYSEKLVLENNDD